MYKAFEFAIYKECMYIVLCMADNPFFWRDGGGGEDVHNFIQLGSFRKPFEGEGTIALFRNYLP